MKSAISLSALAAMIAASPAMAEPGDRGHVNRPDQSIADVAPADAVTTPDPVEFNLDNYVGFTFKGKPIIDLDGVIDHIDSGARDRVNAGMITYTFLKQNHLTGLFNNPTLGFTAGFGVGPFSEKQKVAARESIGLWDDLVAHDFVEKTGQGADIRFANSSDPAQAYAYYPSDSHGYKFTGDVFISDPAGNVTNNWLGFNGYGATTMVHEIGHSQGLSHPGSYNYDPNLPLSYANYAEYAQDSEQYSIMSYWNPEETYASYVDWSTFLFGNVQTPMLHDIVTIQSIYGADTTTRSTDTVYGFNSTAGRDVYDFTKNIYPALTIYDAGGNDTLDFSGFAASVHIDLHDASYSSAAAAVPTAAEINAKRDDLNQQVGAVVLSTSYTQATVDAVSASYIDNNELNLYFDSGLVGLRATSLYNIAIAYGTVIENGIGGSARDLLWGNEVANMLSGNDGDDVIDGFEGADTYTGGAGADVFAFSVIEAGDAITDFTSADGDTIDLTGTGVAWSFVGNAAFTNTAGELRTDAGYLYGDADGDGSADLVIDLRGASVGAGDLTL